MSDLAPYILASAERHNLDPALVSAVVQQESGGNANAQNPAGGGVGAWGPMQVRGPALADYNAANGTNYKPQDLTKPQVGIDVGSWYLGKQLDQFNDPSKALVAYNEGAGSPNVAKGATPYASQVLGRINGQNQTASAPKMLPGIPVSKPQAGGADDLVNSYLGKAPAQDGAADALVNSYLSPAPAAQAAPSQQPAAPAQATADQPGLLSSIGAGLGRGVQETALGGQQLLGHALTSAGFNNAGKWLIDDANKGLQAGAQEVSPYDAAHPIATGAGKIGGSIAATAPLAMLAPEAVGLAGTAGVGAGLGAASGALSPVDPNAPDFASAKAQQVGLGALTGGALSPVAKLAGNIISPNVSPDVKALVQRGITPTPGQILGGAAAATEEKLTSVPVLGDLIKNAQQRAVQQFNRATYDDALAPIGAAVPDSVATGSDAVKYVNQQIGKVYQSIEPKANFVADQNFSNDLDGIRNQLSQTAPGVLPQFDNIVKNQIEGKLANGQIGTGGTMTGSQWGDTRSMISNLSRKQTLGNADADKWALSDALDDLNGAVNQAVGRASPPDVLQDLQKANASWANYKQIEKAAGSVGASNNGNVFSPAQFTSSVRAGSTASQRATNSGLNADLGQSAQSVLGNKYPDSGTAGRGLLSLLTGGVGAGLATAPGTTIATLGGIGAGSLPYTALGQRAAAALLTSRPQFAQPVGKAVSGLGRLIVPGSLPAILSGSQ